MYETMFSPLSIGSVTLKNRIIFAPTTMGFAGEAYLSSMERIAAGGAAMLVIGDVPALNEPPSFGAPSPLTEDGFFFYQKLAEKIHRHGAAACAQLHMSDTDTSAVSGLIPNLKAGLISMDEMRRFIHSRVRPFITQMSADRILSSQRALEKAQPDWSRPALTWCRSTATGCAAAFSAHCLMSGMTGTAAL